MLWIILTAIVLAAIATATVLLAQGRARRRIEATHTSHKQALARLGSEHDARLGRLRREAEVSRRFSHHQLVSDILPVVDALEEAQRCAHEAEQAPIEQGIALALGALIGALSRHGVVAIQPGIGDAFEPTWHEAVNLVESETIEAGHVARCLRSGYRDDDRVLRAAMVEVVKSVALPIDPEPCADSPDEADTLQAGGDEPD
ncbi:MAG: nucleotide exchange factor GrpE [Bradymonadaceae bacterium]|nr:nucleotide exchange factor GrpE [Lujinxingiaceae bacterium]